MRIRSLSKVFLLQIFIDLVSVLAFNYSCNSEGISFELLRRELEDVVRIQIKSEPYKNNYGKRYKARTVVDYRKKGKQKNPEDDIISIPNKPEWVSERLID